MQFNSVEFILFFPVFAFLFYTVNKKFRVTFIVISSSLFYLTFIPHYIILIYFVIINDFFTAKSIESSESQIKKKHLLLRSIIINVLILIAFKYLNFLNDNLTSIAGMLHWNYSISSLKVLIPLGLSFYVFKSISYVIEVYRNNIKAEGNFLVYTSYVMLFPELLAGPIDRPQNLIPQFKIDHIFDRTKFITGIKLIILGYFQKTVIADRIDVLVNYVYTTYKIQTGPVLTIATIFFALQIYCDFAGYSNIAIGIGKILGFDLMQNFNKPYFAKSISEFWRRWHISLTTWLRDYIFLPITYATIRKISKPSFLTIRKDEMGYYIGTVLTMLIAGFWHGASWTFICWGLILGLYMCASVFTRKIRKRLLLRLKINRSNIFYKIVTNIFIFSLISFAWIFFKSSTIKQALVIISRLISGWSSIIQVNDFVRTYLVKQYLGINPYSFYFCVILIILHFVYEYSFTDVLSTNQKYPVFYALFFVFIFSLILFFGVFSSQQFIYFQF